MPFKTKTLVARSGVSEITASIIMLLISVILSVILFSTFNVYLGEVRLNIEEIAFSCEFAIVDVAVNETDDGLWVAVLVYNTGDITCTLADKALLLDVKGNAIASVELMGDAAIGPREFGLVRFFIEDVRPPFRVRLASRDGHVDEAFVN